MGAAVSGRSRLEDQVASLRKKLADTQRSVQRSQRDKESYLVRQPIQWMCLGLGISNCSDKHVVQGLDVEETNSSWITSKYKKFTAFRIYPCSTASLLSWKTVLGIQINTSDNWQASHRLSYCVTFQTSQAQVKVLTSEKEALQWELEVLKQKAEAVCSVVVLDSLLIFSTWHHLVVLQSIF